MQLQLDLDLPRDRLSVPVIRRVLGDSLRTLGVVGACIDDIEVALTEACTNVLDHAQDGEVYHVSARIDGASCVLEVADKGAGFDDAPHGHADAVTDAETGRGIQLMRRLVDSVRFEPRATGGTVVHLRKALQFDDDAPGPRLATSEPG
jgi:serine/threonine-protein kinase RsbW